MLAREPAAENDNANPSERVNSGDMGCMMVLVRFALLFVGCIVAHYAGFFDAGYREEERKQVERGREILRGLERAYSVSDEEHERRLREAYRDAPTGRAGNHEW